MKLVIKSSYTIPQDELHLYSHPDNLDIARHVIIDNNVPTIFLIDSQNNRTKNVSIYSIESIKSLNNYCEAMLFNQEKYLIHERLKNLSFLTKYNFIQINHSELIAKKAIESFTVEKQARLKIVTFSNREFIVSRHYSKALKEALSYATTL